MLLPGQTAYDRPDIVVRIFHRKVKMLISNIKKGIYFKGMKLIYMMRVIEYQHRGFPHMHLVIKLDGAPDRDSTNNIIY